VKRSGSTLALTVVVAGCMVLASKDHVRFNLTDSMPLGVWLVGRTGGELKRGDVVTVCLPTDTASAAFQSGYIGVGLCADSYEPILKPIGAVAGDVVTVSSTGLAVNGVAVPNTVARQADTTGRLMNPVPPGEYRVEPGTVWIIAPRHELSFDSRYFGPVSVSAVTGMASPLLTSN
jgi:conjugative transfer signal peptidase TraF